jgi:ribosomal protein S19
MLHNEHLRKADELYECRHDNNGNVIHIYIKDGEAIIFPTLDSLVRRVYFGEEVERFYVNEDILEELYDRDEYDYYELKNIVLTEINLD